MKYSYSVDYVVCQRHKYIASTKIYFGGPGAMPDWVERRNVTALNYHYDFIILSPHLEDNSGQSQSLLNSLVVGKERVKLKGTQNI